MNAHLVGAAPAELLAVLDAIAEATVPTPQGDARLRYSREGVDGLGRLVVSWNVNPRLLDLAFLVAAVAQCHGDAVAFFLSAHRDFTGREGFRASMAVVAEAGDARHRMDARGLVSRYDDEERVVWWNRDVLVLPPLFELLLTANGSLIEDCGSLGDRRVKAADVRRLAARWQQRIYDWLKCLVKAEDEDDEAGPLAPLTRQRARHFSWLARWLRALPSDRDNTPLAEILDDDAVLAFWCQRWPGRPGADAPGDADAARYRSFEHLADVAMQFWNASEAGLARLRPHQPVGVDAGEWDGAADNGAAEDFPATTLRSLESPPLAAVKFLKDTEKRLVQPLLNASGAMSRMPLTLVRAQTFGVYQRRLGRALGTAELPALVGCDDVRPYKDWIEEVGALRTRLLTMRDCCLHVLIHLRSSVAVARIRLALPDLSCWRAIEASLLETAERRRKNDAQVLAAFSSAFFDRLGAERLRSPSLSALLSRAAQAYRRVNVRGFATLPDPHTTIGGMAAADVFATGDACLGDLVAAIDGFLAAWRIRVGSADAAERIFASDRSLFQEGFARLYAQGDTR